MYDNPIDIASEVSKRVEEEQFKFGHKSFSASSGDNIDGIAGDEIMSIEEIMKAFSQNQDGDAEIFIRLNRGRFVYDHAAGHWFVFTGYYWKEDLIDEALKAVSSVADLYMEEYYILSESFLDSDRNVEMNQGGQQYRIPKERFKRIRALQSLKWKNDILTIARSGKDSLAITGQEWDRDPWLLACFNAVIDLKDGTTRQGRPEDYIKTAAPTEWRGLDAPCPRWEKFLSDIFAGDELLISFIQRLFGYGITGLTTHHIFVILWGRGRNGKGTLLEVLRRVLGDCAMKTEAELLLQQKYARQAGSPNSAVLSLKGRRVVWASESGEEDSFNVGKLKELVGGDTLSARAVYGKHPVTFEPTHLLMLLTNSKPSVPSNDYAFWKRVVLIPFERSFVDQPQENNESKADPDLIEKLKEEASGILGWLVRGCLAWQKEGLNIPEEVIAAIESYRTHEDHFENFVLQCCSEGESLNVRAKEFYESYRQWALKRGAKARSNVLFGKEMKKRFDSHQDRNGIVYDGVGVNG